MGWKPYRKSLGNSKLKVHNVKIRLQLPLFFLFALLSRNALGTVFYVDVNSTNPTPPYASWGTAANSIQDAINIGTNGDNVFVADGTYTVGNTSANGANRVALNSAITVQSMNGPSTTTIQGQNSNPALRCVYLATGATLIGFTLSNGNGVTGGGGAFCTSGSSILSNCVVSGNTCILDNGGGVNGGTLYNCLISNNSAPGYGTYPGCGGGVCGSLCFSCTLSGNSSANAGGGAYASTLNNCLVSGNNVVNPSLNYGSGGGAQSCTLNNCTVVGNYVIASPSDGGGTEDCTLNNSIVFDNSPDNDSGSTCDFCCITPLPAAGSGNFTNDPLFALGSYELQTNSPCVNSGDNSLAISGVDLDGNQRIVGNYVDVGAYELQSALPPSAFVSAAYSNLVAGYADSFVAGCNWGVALSVAWDFGDGTMTTNTFAPTHTFNSTGDYLVTATVYGVNNSTGLSATTMVHVAPQIYCYVGLNSTNPVEPFSSWQTAATNIQDAIDAASPGSTIFVTDGIYKYGGRIVYGAMSNRVAATLPVTIQSVNGPTVTFIQGVQTLGSIFGGSSMRCVYLTNNSVLSGFTISEGSTSNAGDGVNEESGGGVWCASTNVIVTNCVISGNSAYSVGGGVYGGTLNNCRLTNNFSGVNGGAAAQSALHTCELSANEAGVNGGGAYASILNNCTLTGNSSGAAGGGCSDCVLTNCIVYYNNAPTNQNCQNGMMSYCCSVPIPASMGNILAEPQITDNYHLAANSPCRSAGTPANFTATDIDGKSWLNPPSIGCDEFYSNILNGPLSVSIQAPITNLAVGSLETLTATISGRVSYNVWNLGNGIMLTNCPNITEAWMAAGTYAVTFTAFNEDYPNGVSAAIDLNVLDRVVHYVSQSGINPVSPYLSWDNAATNIQDAVDSANNGDYVLVTNGVYQTGSRVSPDGGTNRVVVTNAITLQSVNGSAVTAIDGGKAVRCVYLGPGGIFNGFTLTNGNIGYNTTGLGGGGAYCGAHISFSEIFSDNELIENCLIISNSSGAGGGVQFGVVSNCVLTLNRSSGPGGGTESSVSYNCIYSNNYAEGVGGGAAGGISTLNNCMLIGNVSISPDGGAGGGVYGSTLNNCLVISNTALGIEAGGAAGCILNNCTVVGNKGGIDGGAGYAGFIPYIKNCIVYFNSEFDIGPGAGNIFITNCCTPRSNSSVTWASFTNAPLFVNPAAGDFHLQSSSPCINAGNNSLVTTTVDFDGNPRIVGGTVDIGAYEYQTPSSVLSYVWAQQYGLPIDGSADYLDSDGTGMNNWQKWIAGLNPTNPASVLVMLPLSATNNLPGITVSWQSVSNRTYYLQRAANLSALPAFSAIQSNIVGHAGTTSYTDTTVTNGSSYFYRVGVR